MPSSLAFSLISYKSRNASLITLLAELYKPLSPFLLTYSSRGNDKDRFIALPNPSAYAATPSFSHAAFYYPYAFAENYD